MRNLILAALLGAQLSGCAVHHVHSTAARETLLHLYLPEAHRVEIVTSVDGYQPHPASPGLSGTWTVSVSTADEFQYFYIVDGKVYHPDCRYRQMDDFGAHNCVHQP